MSYKKIQNIGSIKTLVNLSWIIYFFSLFFGSLLSFIFAQTEGVLSYIVGFISFSLIFFSLFLSMKKRVHGEEIENKFSQKFTVGMSISFSFGRIIAYTIVFVFILLLIHFNLFSLYAYIAGIFFSLLATLFTIKIKYLR